MARPAKFSPEAKARAVRRVLGHPGEYGRQLYGAIQSVAGTIGCHPETLRVVRAAGRARHRSTAGLTTDERARLTAVERENRQGCDREVHFA